MTGKDFELIANVIRTFEDDLFRQKLIARLIIEFTSHYTRFDRDRFMAAIERED